MAAVCNPRKTYKGSDNKLLSTLDISSSDSIISQMTAGEIGTRLDNEFRPSRALTATQIKWN